MYLFGSTSGSNTNSKLVLLIIKTTLIIFFLSLCQFLRVDLAVEMHVGRKIKLVRIAKGLTQQGLADKIGKTRPLVSSIEQTGIVNVHTLRDICKALDIDQEEVDQIGSINDPMFPYSGKKIKEIEEQLRAEIKKLKSENEMLKDLAESQKDLIKFLKNQPAKGASPKKK